jgi:magnesium chelatase family protein
MIYCSKRRESPYERKTARTAASLDGAEKIGRLHLAEALSYRALADDLRRAA